MPGSEKKDKKGLHPKCYQRKIHRLPKKFPSFLEKKNPGKGHYRPKGKNVGMGEKAQGGTGRR